MLTIIIPTYNRAERLKKLLLSIEKEKNKDYKIIIIDNNSSYDIKSYLNSNLEKEFLKKIELRKNKINIGMIGNVSNCFNVISEGWIWLISDDDEIIPGAIEKIKNEIKKYKDYGMIKFSTEGIGEAGQEKNKDILTLEELIDYAEERKYINSGNLVFMSNNLFNVDILKEYYSYLFDYSYTQVPHMIPILIGLNKKEVKLRYNETKIIRYIPADGDGWSVKKVILGASTFAHLPINLDKIYMRKFYKMIMWIDYKYCLIQLMKKDKEVAKDVFEDIYHLFYKKYLPLKDKIFIKIFCIGMTKKTIPIILKVINLLKKLRRK